MAFVVPVCRDYTSHLTRVGIRQSGFDGDTPGGLPKHADEPALCGGCGPLCALFSDDKADPVHYPLFVQNPETAPLAPAAAQGEPSQMAGSGRHPRRPSAPHDAFAAIDEQFCSVVDSAGMFQALAMLNARTRYRFTGVYRVEPPFLRNEQLFDRENPTVSLGGDVSRLDDTYCGIVASTAAPFLALDSRSDPRLDRHPARDSVVSYIGVPIRNATGRIFGTLCHFDRRPRILPLHELAVLESIACHVSDWLTRNSQPTT